MKNSLLTPGRLKCYLWAFAAPLRYSVGFMPKCFLKVRLKYGTLSNPESAATFIMLSSEVVSRRQACFSRLFMMYADTVQFIRELKNVEREKGGSIPVTTLDAQE